MSLVCLLLLLTPAAVPAQAPRTDLHGDPLPPGAVLRLGSLRFHHAGRITAICFAPDGSSLLVAGHEDGKHSVRLWDAVSGKELGRFAVERYVHGAAFTPDGKHVLLATDHGLSLHERGGKHVRTFGDGELESWALSPDGTVVAAHPHGWEQETPIRLWELATGKELPALSGRGAGWYGALRFSADGKRLVCRAVVPNQQGDSDIGPGNARVVTVWDVAGRKKLHERTVPNDDVALSPDGETMALHVDGGVRTVHLPSGKQSPVLTSDARLLAFRPDGKALLTVDREGAPVLWDATTARELRAFAVRVHERHALAAFSPDGSAIALTWSGTWDATTVVVVDVATGQPRRHGDGHHGAVRCAAVAPDGKRLASGDDDGTMLVWDLAAGKPLLRLEGHAGGVGAVAFSPDGGLVASAAADGEVRLWDVAGGKRLARWLGPAGPNVLRFSADGKALTVGTSHGEVRAWSVPGGKLLHAFSGGERAEVFDLAADGSLALGTAPGPAGGRGTYLRLWLTAQGRPMQAIPLHRPGLPASLYDCRAAASSPGGRLLAWTQGRLKHGPDSPRVIGDRELRLWERASGQELTPVADVGAVALAFSPDGRLLAGPWRERDGIRQVALWDVLTGEHRATLRGHQSRVGCVVFTPDGRHVITGGGDHTLLVWEVPAHTVVRAQPLPAGQLARWWDELAADAAVAYPALAGLVDYPEMALPWLQKQLRPAPAVDAARIAALVAALDSSSFKERQQAQRALEDLGELAEPALRKALEGNPHLELRRRAEQLLAKIEAMPPTPEQLRLLRAVAALEMIGDDDARLLLEKLAGGAPEARLTCEAAGALARMARRKAS